MSITEETALVKQRAGGKAGYCSICCDPLVFEINEAIVQLPLGQVASRYSYKWDTVKRHTVNCLGKTQVEIQEGRRISAAADVEQRYQFVMNEAEEAYLAAKDVLMVDGDLCLDPRSWEISVIYLDYNDRDPVTNLPRLKSGTLDDILGELASQGMVVKHSFVKSEDMRKGLREALQLFTSIIDRFGKVFGVFQRDKANTQDELEDIRATLHRMADKMRTTYAYELERFLQDQGGRVRGDLRGMLEKESLSLSGALAQREDEGNSLSHSHQQNDPTPEGHIIDVEETPPAPQTEEKTQENAPDPDSEKNPGENFDLKDVETIECPCGHQHPGKTDGLLLRWTCPRTGEDMTDVDLT